MEAGTPSEVARVPIQFPAQFQGKFRVVVPADTLASPDPGGEREATINGGTNLPYPPVILAVRLTRADDRLSVLVRGVELSRVQQLNYVPRGELRRVPLAIASKTAESMVASADLPYLVGAGRIEVETDDGAVASEAVDGEQGAGSTSAAKDRFLIRFHPGQVGEAGTGSQAIDRCSFIPSQLRSALAGVGVTELEPVFPWFAHSDVNSTNLIGERVLLEDLADYFYASVPTGGDARTAAKSAASIAGVLHASPDYGGPALATVPNDPKFPVQWSLRNTGQTICQQHAGVPDLGAIYAWDLTTGAPSVRVAVLDTGIDTTHVELAGHVRGGPAFVQPPVSTSMDDDTGRHGTAVTGIAAATGNNSVGIAGVGWSIVPHAVKVVRGSDAFSRASWIGQGIGWTTANDIPIVNMSIGFTEIDCYGGTSIPPDSANVMNVACLNALYKGQFLVAAMGNCNAQVRSWPAAFSKRVYAVGAVSILSPRWRDIDFAPDFCAQHPCFGSAFGPWIDAAAPGGRLIVTLGAGPSALIDVDPNCNASQLFGMAFGGTSAAAPHVSGAAALLRSYNFTLLGEDVEQILNRTATHYTDPWEVEVGYGPINAAAALNYIKPPRIIRHHTVGSGGTHGPLVLIDSTQVQIDFYNVPGLPFSGTYTCWRHRLRGVVAINDGFLPPPTVPPSYWVRASGTLGWHDTTYFDYNEEVNWGRSVGPATFNADTFETFVFRIIDPNTGQGRWYPVPPAAAVVAFTVAGYTSGAAVPSAGSRDRVEVRTFPNPTARRVTIDLALPSGGFVTAAIHDVSGRRIAELSKRELPAGSQRLYWDGRTSEGERCVPGVYFLVAELPGRTVTRRLVLLGGSER